MDKALFDDYVTNRYKAQMEYYRNSAQKNQKKYKTLQWVLIVLSALTPVLAALNGINWSHDTNANPPDANTSSIISHLVQILLVVIASIVAILTTGLKTFRYQDLWVIYRATYEQLKPEFYYYEFNIGPYGAANADKESIFVTHVEAILSNEHGQWKPTAKLEEQK